MKYSSYIFHSIAIYALLCLSVNAYAAPAGPAGQANRISPQCTASWSDYDKKLQTHINYLNAKTALEKQVAPGIRKAFYDAKNVLKKAQNNTAEIQKNLNNLPSKSKLRPSYQGALNTAQGAESIAQANYNTALANVSSIKVEVEGQNLTLPEIDAQIEPARVAQVNALNTAKNCEATEAAKIRTAKEEAKEKAKNCEDAKRVLGKAKENAARTQRAIDLANLEITAQTMRLNKAITEYQAQDAAYSAAEQIYNNTTTDHATKLQAKKDMDAAAAKRKNAQHTVKLANDDLGTYQGNLAKAQREHQPYEAAITANEAAVAKWCN